MAVRTTSLICKLGLFHLSLKLDGGFLRLKLVLTRFLSYTGQQSQQMVDCQVWFKAWLFFQRFSREHHHSQLLHWSLSLRLNGSRSCDLSAPSWVLVAICHFASRPGPQSVAAHCGHSSAIASAIFIGLAFCECSITVALCDSQGSSQSFSLLFAEGAIVFASCGIASRSISIDNIAPPWLMSW